MVVRAGLVGAALGACAFAMALPPPPPESPSRPDLLLISVDTLRPDALGWVAGRNPTPALDALARGGVRFPAAVSPAPLTLPAHVSLMTGVLPRRHGVRDNGQVLGRSPATLAEALRAHGYATAAFVSGYTLRAQFGLDRGFDHYDDALPAGEDAWRERPAPQTTAAALSWLRSRTGSVSARRQPFFVFVHYYDAHDPYAPPARLAGAGPRGAYDGEVRYVDEAVGDLRRGLEAIGAGRNLLTIFAADHGESLGEHGEDTHGFFVYDATVLVPLVFHFPGRLSPAESTAPARLLDVAPTALELLGLGGWGAVDGVSLMPALGGREQQVPPAYLESQQPWLGYGWAPLAAIRADGLKLIEAPRPELYDLRSDPGESSDLSGRKPEVARRLLAEMRRIEGGPPAATRPAPDPEALERLRTLGYAGGAAVTPPTASKGLADPKDRLAQKRALAEAEARLLARDHAAALAAFDVVLAAEPDNRLALLRSGASLVALFRPREAVPRLERLVEIDPDHGEARYVLADALTRAGERTRAVEQWQEALRLQPRRAVAWSNLGAVLAQSGRVEDAAGALERAHALEPTNAVLAENLGAVRYRLAVAAAREGRVEEARRWLGEAVQADPRLRNRAAQDPGLAALLTP
jgi:arylsulfatase A-like enzyme/Flp pilus assembly protein TadD